MFTRAVSLIIVLCVHSLANLQPFFAGKNSVDPRDTEAYHTIYSQWICCGSPGADFGGAKEQQQIGRSLGASSAPLWRSSSLPSASRAWPRLCLSRLASPARCPKIPCSIPGSAMQVMLVTRVRVIVDPKRLPREPFPHQGRAQGTRLGCAARVRAVWDNRASTGLALLGLLAGGNMAMLRAGCCSVRGTRVSDDPSILCIAPRAVAGGG
jgi:hypothetical protein